MRNQLRLYTLIFLILLVIPCYLLITSNHAHHSKTKPLVLCTTTMLADAVKCIAHDTVEIHTLMKPGTDPHIYQARESDVHHIVNADIIFYHGLHLEGKLSHLFHNLNNTTVVDTSTAIPAHCLIPGDTDLSYDPHTWHDVQLWIQGINTVTQALMKTFPAQSGFYKDSAMIYIHELQTLDQELKALADQLKSDKKILITAHDAFSYFGRAYGFKVISLQGINTQTEVSLSDINQLVEYIVNHKVPTIFLETSTPERNIQTIEYATAQHKWHLKHAEELFSDSLDKATQPAGNYIGMMRYNMNTVVNSLKQ